EDQPSVVRNSQHYTLHATVSRAIYLNPALRTRKKGGLFGRPPSLNGPVGPSSLRRSCGRSSSKPRRPQPSVFPQPPSPDSSVPADRCRGYSCPRPLSDPTD